MTATTLIPVNDAALKAARPDWPLSAWATRWHIRQKRIGCVRLGRRVFVTPELLEAFIASQTVRP